MTNTTMPLRVCLYPSRYLLVFTIVSHGLAVTALGFTAISVSLRWVLLVLVVLSLLWSLCRHWWIGDRVLSYHQGRWILATKHKTLTLRLQGESLVATWLLVLRFLDENDNTRMLVIPPDSADNDELRRLRVVLNFGVAVETEEINS